LFAGLTLFLADALTFSRGGYLGFLMAGTAFLVFSWLNLKEKLQKSILIMGSVFIALFLFFGQPITTRFVSSFTLEDSSSSERLVLWETAFENIQKRPFFGAGLGNYILVVNPIAKYRLPYYAHNLYLDIATELGLSGLFFFILLIGVSYSYILKNVRMNHVDFVALGTLSALTLYLTHSLFETALYSVHILPLLLFILVLGYRKRKEYETQS
ncbi:MAG: O-antigen ligase family protein, partial [Candidatus Moraniibacteriota bacterium]